MLGVSVHILSFMTENAETGPDVASGPNFGPSFERNVIYSHCRVLHRVEIEFPVSIYP